MKIESLPHYIEQELVFDDWEAEDDGHTEMRKWFLNFSRDAYGQWSCAYMTWVEGMELIIPELWLNNAETLEEAAIRMDAKLKRWKKLHG